MRSFFISLLLALSFVAAPAMANACADACRIVSEKEKSAYESKAEKKPTGARMAAHCCHAAAIAMSSMEGSLQLHPSAIVHSFEPFLDLSGRNPSPLLEPPSRT